MKLFRALGITLCVLALAACEPPKSKQEIFLDGQFSITRPASWSLRSDLNDEADLQMANVRREGYAVVLSEAKVDFDDDMSLADFSEITRAGIIDTLSNPVVGSAETLSLNGNPAIRYELSGSVDKVKIRYWHISVDAGNHYHQLMIWSLPSMFEKNLADFELVMNSFKAE